MKLTYPAIFEPLGDRPGYVVTVPDLPGCVTEGDSLADAIIMAEDAASGWVLDELEDGKQPPKASELTVVHTEEGQFVSLLALDMDRYAEKYGAKAVRKNVTIPAWLNTYAESRNLNFSKVLQDALQELYQAT
ncbi:MAG: type II toxin-antitoxin system HicB family antitoxin [Clostridiales bacterium]|nr:type II toxin-antitoxin system HicB family antitoxin [Clostridiales bacterium]